MNKKAVLLIILLLVGAVIAVRLIWFQDELSNLKKTEKAVLVPEAEKVLYEGMSFLERKDYKSFHGLMSGVDGIMFQESYVNGLFAGSDFVPVSVTDEVRKLKTSSTEHIMVVVKSKPRQMEYVVSMVRKDGKWKILSIAPAKTK